MQMPQPSAQHRALEVFAGTWTGTETLHPSPWDPKGGTSRATIRNVMSLDGFAVVQDYEQARGGMVNFRGHGVMRYDTNAVEYVFHWFDSWGGPPTEFRGPGADAVFTLSNAGQQGHTRAIFDFRQGSRYTYRMDVSPDGAHWATFMDGVYTRQP